jgi:hypothetical protein
MQALMMVGKRKDDEAKGIIRYFHTLVTLAKIALFWMVKLLVPLMIWEEYLESYDTR